MKLKSIFTLFFSLSLLVGVAHAQGVESIPSLEEFNAMTDEEKITLFEQFELLPTENKEEIQNILNEMPDGMVYWDEYYRLKPQINPQVGEVVIPSEGTAENDTSAVDSDYVYESPSETPSESTDNTLVMFGSAVVVLAILSLAWRISRNRKGEEVEAEEGKEE